MRLSGRAGRCPLFLLVGWLGGSVGCQEVTGADKAQCRRWVALLSDPQSTRTVRAAARQGLLRSGAVAAEQLVHAVAHADRVELQSELFGLIERMGPDAAEPMMEYVVALGTLPEGAHSEFARACLHTVPFSDRFWSEPWPALSRMLPRQLPVRLLAGRGNVPRNGSELAQTDHWLGVLAKGDQDPRKLSVVLANVGQFRYEAFWLRALALHGVAAREVLPGLAKRVAFPVPKQVLPLDKLRYLEICRAMLSVDPAAPESAVAHAYLMIYHPDPDRRRRAAMELSRCGGGLPRQVVPQLIHVLRVGELPLRREAVTALGFYGTAAEAGLDELRSLVSHDDPELAARAKATLRRLEK